MAVVLQRTDPLSAAADAAGAYFTSRRNAQLQNYAQQYQQQRDQRSDYVADRSYGLDEKKFGLDVNADQRAGKLADETIKSSEASIGQIHADTDEAKVRTKAAQAQLDFENQTKQIRMDALTLDNKFKKGEIDAQHYAIQKAASDAVVAHIQAQVEQKYGMKQGELSVQQAQANVGATQASTAASYASANDSNAQAYRAMHPVAPRESATERAMDAETNAFSSLDARSQSFLDSVNDPKNPMTRLQAMAKLAGDRSLPPDQKKALRTVLLSRSSSFATPENLYNNNRNAVRDGQFNARLDAMSSRQAAAEIVKNPQFAALPINDQQDFLEGVNYPGVGYKKAVQNYIQSAKSGNTAAQGVLDTIGVSYQ